MFLCYKTQWQGQIGGVWKGAGSRLRVSLFHPFNYSVKLKVLDVITGKYYRPIFRYPFKPPLRQAVIKANGKYLFDNGYILFNVFICQIFMNNYQCDHEDAILYYTIMRAVNSL